MSVRHGLLALLEREPMHGYQLRAAFERSTGATWPLNIGQVYQTLTRLERDGLVVGLEENDVGQRRYEITDAGRAEVAVWFSTPVARADRPRDELAIKLALSFMTPGVDAAAVIQTQRSATLRTLQEYTRLKVGADDQDVSWLLVLDSLVFAAEAEMRWLDHCEIRLARYRSTHHHSHSTSAPETASQAPETADRGAATAVSVRKTATMIEETTR